MIYLGCGGKDGCDWGVCYDGEMVDGFLSESDGGGVCEREG